MPSLCGFSFCTLGRDMHGWHLQARASAAYPSLMADQPAGQMLGGSHHASSHAMGIPPGALPGDSGVTRLRSRQGSLQEPGPCPSDWDPLYSCA